MTAPGKTLDLDGMEKVATEAAAMLRDPRGLSHDEMAKRFSDFMAATRPADVLALIQTQRELVGALKLAERLVDEALPKFDWGRSSLDANAIGLLNDAPRAIRAALTKALGEQPL